MILNITEQTENILYIIGGFIAGVIIALISNLLSNWQIKRIEKTKYKNQDCLKLLTDIQNLIQKDTETYMFTTIETVVKNRNTLLKAFQILKAYYTHYKIYFSTNNDFEKFGGKINALDDELSEKIREYSKSKDQSILKEMNDKLLEDYDEYLFNCSNILCDNLSLYLFKYHKEKAYCKKFNKPSNK